ncbi:MAG: hypothetical protein C5B53_07110 [Candidatus Melainabacteria bacterium]|nr:MAG: hypothetical protein C5B53_07110 [Candidatus Melainabacteria bacterium]
MKPKLQVRRRIRFFRPGNLRNQAKGDCARITPIRSEHGAILALWMLLAVALLFACVFFSGQIAPLFMLHSRHQQAIEAASLKAASDLSRVVVNDPYWGYVSLSDYPATGAATMAGDGQPLPVHSINTILAATRLDYLIAQELGNATLEELSLEDLRNAKEAEKRLARVLERSIKENNSDARDINGASVNTTKDAWETYIGCLGALPKANENQFKLTLGKLNDTAATTIRLPFLSDAGKRSKYFPKDIQVNGCYRADVEVPVGPERLSFLAVAGQPSLVNSNKFVPAQEKDAELSSIVRIEAACELRNLWEKTPQVVCGSACAEACTLGTTPAPSVLLVSFPGGRPSSLTSIGDLLNDHGLSSTMMNSYIPRGNDYPQDAGCSLEVITRPVSASSAIAYCFHDWLRSNYSLPRIDSVISALTENLNGIGQSFNSSFVLAVKADGSVVVSPLHNRPFQGFSVEENQFYSVASEPVLLGDRDSIIMCRDQVRSLGTASGGKHAGQPLPGDPINWDELGYYVDNSFSDTVSTRKPDGITIAGRRRPNGGIILADAQLKRRDGRTLEYPVRTSTYSTGLAAEISVSPLSVVHFWSSNPGR